MAKYGHKADAIRLMHEWLDTVARDAGFSEPRTECVVLSGTIGCEESKIELEIREGLRSLSDFDELVRNVDAEKHREWGTRFAEHVVDGTTKWEIMPTHPMGDKNDGSGGKYARPGVSRTQPRRVMSPSKTISSFKADSGDSINNVDKSNSGRDMSKNTSGGRSKYEEIPEEELVNLIGQTLPDGRRVIENAFGVPMVILPGDVGMF